MHDVRQEQRGTEIKAVSIVIFTLPLPSMDEWLRLPASSALANTAGKDFNKLISRGSFTSSRASRVGSGAC